MNKFFTIAVLTLLPLSALAAQAAGANGASKPPIEIVADSLEVFQSENKAIFTGNVDAKQGYMKLKADKMIVHYASHNDPNAPKPAPKPAASAGSNMASSNSITLVEVEGHVFVSNPIEAARGDKGFYDTTKDFVSLTGNVVLTKGGNVLKGDKLDFDVGGGHSKLVTNQGSNGGRVRGLFVPADNTQPTNQ